MPIPATEIIDRSTLLERVRSGAIRGAHVIGEPGGWHLVVSDGKIQRALSSPRGSPRLFRRLETLVGYLKEIGLEHFEVDATLYASKGASRPRSDSAKRAQDEGAEHDGWFRAEVGRTLDGIDRGEVRLIPDDEHRARWRQIRADLLARSRREG